MLITSPNNPTPQVGQIFYCEHQNDDGQFKSASLNFIDEKPDDGAWMVTWLALIEDVGVGVQIYAGTSSGSFEAGGMPHQYTRLATEEDLQKVIQLFKEGKTQDPDENLDTWLEKVREDSVLLAAEKERIECLLSNS